MFWFEKGERIRNLKREKVVAHVKKNEGGRNDCFTLGIEMLGLKRAGYATASRKKGGGGTTHKESGHRTVSN